MQSPNDTLQKVRPPAIALIVVGALNGGLGLLMLASGLLRLVGAINTGPAPTDEAQRTGYLVGTLVGYGLGFISLILAPAIIFGAVKMVKGQSFGLAKAAAVLAILPLTSCCFLAGIPIGIWSLIVLNKPDVKALFQSGPGRG